MTSWKHNANHALNVGITEYQELLSRHEALQRENASLIEKMRYVVGRELIPSQPISAPPDTEAKE